MSSVERQKKFNPVVWGLSILGALSWASNSKGFIEILDFFDKLLDNWRAITQSLVQVAIDLLPVPVTVTATQKDILFMSLVCSGIAVRGYWHPPEKIFPLNPIFPKSDESSDGLTSSSDKRILFCILVLFLFFAPSVNISDDFLPEAVILCLILAFLVWPFLIIHITTRSSRWIAYLSIPIVMLLIVFSICIWWEMKPGVLGNMLAFLVLIPAAFMAIYRSIRPIVQIVGIGIVIVFIGASAEQLKQIYLQYLT